MTWHRQGSWNEHEAGEQGYEDCYLCKPVAPAIQEGGGWTRLVEENRRLQAELDRLNGVLERIQNNADSARRPRGPGLNGRTLADIFYLAREGRSPMEGK